MSLSCRTMLRAVNKNNIFSYSASASQPSTHLSPLGNSRANFAVWSYLYGLRCARVHSLLLLLLTLWLSASRPESDPENGRGHLVPGTLSAFRVCRFCKCCADETISIHILTTKIKRNNFINEFQNYQSFRSSKMVLNLNSTTYKCRLYCTIDST